MRDAFSIIEPDIAIPVSDSRVPMSRIFFNKVISLEIVAKRQVRVIRNKISISEKRGRTCSKHETSIRWLVTIAENHRAKKTGIIYK